MEKRTFTLEEATELLSWLESRFEQLDSMRGELKGVQGEESDLLYQSRRNGEKSLDVKIHESHGQIEKARSRVTEVVEEIEDQGVVLRDINMGLVDFPSVRGNQEVFLCWIRGEGPIRYWHGVNEGYMARRLL